MFVKIEDLDKPQSETSGSSNTDDGSSSLIPSTKSVLSITDLSNNSVEVTEGSSLLVTVQLSAPLEVDLHLKYQLQQQSALSGINFENPNSLNTLTFSKGELTKQILIQTLNDSVFSSSLSFDLVLNFSSSEVIDPITNTNVMANSSTTYNVDQFIDQNLSQSSLSITIKNINPPILQVKPMFVTQGSFWKSLVYKLSDPTQINDTSCVSVTQCANGGEFKKVEVPGESSCTNLEIVDQLDLMKWRCVDSVYPVFFYSYEFKKNKGISDALNATSFKTNFVTVKKNGLDYATSTPAIWWPNPIQKLTLNSALLSDPLILSGTNYNIYTVDQSGTSNGIQISQNNLSLIVLPGATVSANNQTINTVCSTPFFSNMSCLVYPNGQNLHIEGEFSGNAYLQNVIGPKNGSINYFSIYKTKINGGNATVGINFHLGYDLSFKDIEVTSASGVGIYDYWSIASTFKNVNVSKSGIGIQIKNNVTSVFFNEIEVHANAMTGLLVDCFQNCYFNKVYSSNNKGHGIQIQNSIVKPIVFDQVLSVSNGSYGFYTSNTVPVILKNSQFIKNQNGINLKYPSGVTSPEYIWNGFLSRLHIQNNGTGLELSGSHIYSTTHYISANDLGIKINAAVDNDKWEGVLSLNNTTNCQVLSTEVNKGLSSAAGECTPAGASTVTVATGVASGGYYDPSVVPTDLVNLTGGATANIFYTSILDWFNFETPLRSWGKAGRGACVVGDYCDTFNYILNATATPISTTIEAFPSGVGQPCPISVQGDKVYYYYETMLGDKLYIQMPMLINASEFIGDGIGNDNGACESNEVCYYNSQIGFTQNEDISQLHQCVFQDGTGSDPVVGVKMYGK